LTYSVEVRFLGGIEFVVALVIGNLLHHAVRTRGASMIRSMYAASAHYMVPLRA